MIERILEQFLFASRWLLAPFYVALVFGAVGLLVKVLQALLHFLVNIISASESDVILGVLTLVDLTLTGSLVIIVIFAGYEISSRKSISKGTKTGLNGCVRSILAN